MRDLVQITIKSAKIKTRSNELLYAPENVAFTVAGWLYGEDDLGKSLCLAVACGEDTDLVRRKGTVCTP